MVALALELLGVSVVALAERSISYWAAERAPRVGFQKYLVVVAHYCGCFGIGVVACFGVGACWVFQLVLSGTRSARRLSNVSCRGNSLLWLLLHWSCSVFRSWRLLSVLSRIKRNALRASDFKNILSWSPITVVALALELLGVLVSALPEFLNISLKMLGLMC